MTDHRFTFHPAEGPHERLHVWADSLRRARTAVPVLANETPVTVQDHTGAVVWRAADGVPWIDGCTGERR